jgi:hypothetical protein
MLIEPVGLGTDQRPLVKSILILEQVVNLKVLNLTYYLVLNF